MKRFNVAKEERKLNRKINLANNIKIRTIILSIFVLVGSIMLFTYSKYSTSIKLDIMHSKVENFLQDDYILNAYLNGQKDDFPDKNDGYFIDRVSCNKGATGAWDNDEWGIVITGATEEETECNVYFISNVTITYDPSDGTVNPSSASVTKGGTLSLPTPEKEGYTFMGWYTQGGTKVDNSTTWNTSQTIYAKWGIVVTFNTYDEATTITKVIEPGTAYGEFPNANKAHWTTTWYDIDNQVITASSICNYTSDTTVRVGWTWNETDPTVLVFGVYANESNGGSSQPYTVYYTNSNNESVTTTVNYGEDKELSIKPGTTVKFRSSNWVSGQKTLWSQSGTNNGREYRFSNSYLCFTQPTTTGLYFRMMIYNGNGSSSLWAYQYGLSNLSVTGCN